MKKLIRHRRGIALIWTVLFLFLMIGFVGLGTDMGWLVLSAQQLQTGADAAALAAAQRVTFDQSAARDAAVNVAYLNRAAGGGIKVDRNDANSAAGDVVIGRFDQSTNTFTPQTTSPNAVKVVARRNQGAGDGGVKLIFGTAFGVHEVSMERSAIAIAHNTLSAALLVLDPTGECALEIQGNPTLLVGGGSVQVNSSNVDAACSGGSGGTAQLTAPAVNIVGNTTMVAENAPVNTGQPEVPDPLAGLEVPLDGPTRSEPGNGNVTIQPGYYPSGIKRSGGTLTMAPGIYVIDNASKGFELTGNASLIGSGVMIYMKRGGIDLRGGGLIKLSPATEGPYENVTVFQARDNFADSSIRGTNSLSTITGILYFPNNLVTLYGGGGTLGNQIIAWRIRLGGNGTMNVPYDGAESGPPRVYLVE